MLNDDLQRVQIGRDADVPIETNRSLWFLWVYDDGSWDAEAVTRSKNIVVSWEQKAPATVFCVWQGQYRTNLFHMDVNELLKRLKSI
jgi:hypothetical protein